MDEGRAAVALRLLTVADRGRDWLDARPFSVDREADREATRTGARAMLGAEAAALPLRTVVDELL